MLARTGAGALGTTSSRGLTAQRRPIVPLASPTPAQPGAHVTIPHAAPAGKSSDRSRNTGSGESRRDDGPRGVRGRSSGGVSRAGGRGGGRGSGRGSSRGAPRTEDVRPSVGPAVASVKPPTLGPLGPQGGYRLFQISVPAWKDPGKDDYSTHPALVEAVAYRLGVSAARLPPSALRLVRKSFDARNDPRAARGGGRGGRGGGRGAGASSFTIGAGNAGGSKSFVYVVDVDAGAVAAAGVAAHKLAERQNQCERVLPEVSTHGVRMAGEVEAAAAAAAAAAAQAAQAPAAPAAPASPSERAEVLRRADPVVVVGSGPAGLFAALSLAEAGARVVLLERGQPVEQRGRDIGALMVRRILNPDSNLCYGEGGAGTWSDGKLTTRIGRNSDPVRRVLQAFVDFGASPSILVAGKPHLGTDALVRLIKNFRHHLQAAGVEVRFGTTVEDLVMRRGRCEGVRLVGGEELRASAVVLAVGHSARALYSKLHAAEVQLTPKPFALGFRIEHPQALIDTIQYGKEDAAGVMRGKGRLPVADYSLVAEVVDRLTDTRGAGAGAAPWSAAAGGKPASTQELRQAAAAAPGVAPPADEEEEDGGGAAGAPGPDGGAEAGAEGAPGSACSPSGAGPSGAAGAGAGAGSSNKRGVYSFCMCPGGQIVPTSTNEQELCINGMSFSRRNSVWANAALVVAVRPEDWSHLEAEHGPLAAMELQRHYEREGAAMGGFGYTAPVQRVTDFLAGELSTGTLPSSSYRLGVRPGPLHALYAPPLTRALREALGRFDRRLRGFVAEEALLHGVETRTSAPVRIDRDPLSFQSLSTPGLFPTGEGAGYAGGIMSAAVDGLKVAAAVEAHLLAGAGAGR